MGGSANGGFALALVVLAGCSDESPRATAAATAGAGGMGGIGGAQTSSSGASGGGGGSAAAGGGGSASTGGGGSGGTFPGNHDCSPPMGAPPPLKLTELASFDAPLLVKSAPGDPRLYVVEQNGRIRILDGTTTLVPPFLDIAGQVTALSQQGLLGLAFHPDYEKNGRFFVHYNGPVAGEDVIQEFARSADPNVADPTPVATVLTVPQFGGHNGGSIEFGGDGMLYIALGDGANLVTSQDSSLLNGKVLRIDVSTRPYSIPPGNMTGGAPEIWDMGLRNPYRMSFDPCTGDLYIGDVGEGLWEEVDVEPAGRGNRNYGWSTMEGAHCFASATCDPSGIQLPAVEYDHAGGGCAVIGGYVHRSAAIPGLRGAYLYGDLCTQQIWSFVWSDGKVTAQTEWTADLMPGYGIRSFGHDDEGNVLVVAGGTVFRIDAK